MNREWSYLSNSFEVSTRRNYKKMLGLIMQHTSALSASTDPFIRHLYEQSLPVSEAYHTAFSNRTSSKGLRKGETSRFRNLLKELYTKMIPRWEVQVLVRFPEGSPEYRSIFGKGRTGFRRGPYDVRIARVGALARSLEGFDGLFVVRCEAEEYYRKLLAARDNAKGNSCRVRDASKGLEATRRAAAVRMYTNLGFLMGHYADNPGQVKHFFSPGKLRARRPKNRL